MEHDNMLLGGKNFYIRDKLAYTEDHVVVYNIYLYKLHKKITQTDIVSYFTRFGEVLSGRIMQTRKQYAGNVPTTNVGFVNFKSATSAANALTCSSHRIRDKRLLIKACDSWHQPNINSHLTSECVECQNTNNNNNKPMETSEDASSLANILHLDDDSLEAICSKLSPKDQIAFSRTCERFRYIFRLTARTQYRKLNLTTFSSLTLWEIRDFLQVAGRFVKEFYVDGSYKQQLLNSSLIREFNIVGKYCANLTCMRLKTTPGNNCPLNKLLARKPKLTELHLVGFTFNDNAIPLFKRLPALEKLKISQNMDITGNYLDKLVSLKELSLNGCCNIQSKLLNKILSALTELVVLDIRRCFCLDRVGIQILTENCLKLETLKFECTCNNNYDKIATLPKLKTLEFCCSPTYKIDGNLLLALSKMPEQQLEKLTITSSLWVSDLLVSYISKLSKLKSFTCTGNGSLNNDHLDVLSRLQKLEELKFFSCNKITDNGLIRVVEKCKKLKKITFISCSNVTNAFVAQAREVLRQRKVDRKAPLLIHCHNCGIIVYPSDAKDPFVKVRLESREKAYEDNMYLLLANRGLFGNDDESDDESYFEFLSDIDEFDVEDDLQMFYNYINSFHYFAPF